MKSKLIFITTALLILLLFSSCTTPVDEMFYLEPTNDEALAAESNEAAKPTEPEEAVIVEPETTADPLYDLSSNEVIPEPLPAAEPIEPVTTSAPPVPKSPSPEKAPIPAAAAPKVTTETNTQTVASSPITSTAEPEAEEEAVAETEQTVTAEPSAAVEQIKSSDSEKETVNSTSTAIPDNDEREEESLSLSMTETDRGETTSAVAEVLPEEETSETEAAAMEEPPVDPLKKYEIEEKRYLFSNLNETHLFIITVGSFFLLGIVLFIIFRRRGQHQYADEYDED